MIELMAMGQLNQSKCALHKSELHVFQTWKNYVNSLYGLAGEFSYNDFLQIGNSESTSFKKRAYALVHAKMERTRMKRQLFYTDNFVSRKFPTELICITWNVIDSELEYHEDELKRIQLNHFE